MRKFVFLLCFIFAQYVMFHTAIAQKRIPRNFPEYGFFLNKQQLYLQELLEFLRFPSISASSEHLKDVQGAAEWLRNRMLGAGISNVQIFQVGKYPLVYASIPAAVPQAPTVLIYGHFDVQPASVEDGWNITKPFKPRVIQDKIYARGASDDKGSLLSVVHAVEAILAVSQGRSPVNIKLLFEGQEEIGSPDLPSWLLKNRKLIQSDLLISADGSMHSENIGSIVWGLRGAGAIQVNVTGPSHDLHSGGFGGVVQNPIHCLVKLLESMRHENKSIAVEGFYEGTRPITQKEKDFARQSIDFEQELSRLAGVSQLAGGESELFDTVERLWFRPTLDVVGIWGGYMDQGIKTVLPANAYAKLSFRLVQEQVPEKVVEKMIQHVSQHCPAGCSCKAFDLGFHALPFESDPDMLSNQVLRETLLDIYQGEEPKYVRSGASIPIVGFIQKEFQIPAIFLAFGLPDENIHGPNEFYRIGSMDKARKAYVSFLYQLGERYHLEHSSKKPIESHVVTTSPMENVEMDHSEL
ncbi:peptidase M20 [Galdieria sulphuraria]|uniref:Peptidase M20 n=1 Tax=Galdieria sulphuraria TaxID=130081 RepID=M2XP37_GALSU|nr:peptidase M20 [Galdieria sulphuraria]EME31932.1 peptidase M20 [Galdieria sulphuraria]|eukprot:XP_005708452.1 peptidase M20 [Galdieria sulphuraria]